jgi:uncharacterized metal-binding protein YceD (DUF177 family)
MSDFAHQLNIAQIRDGERLDLSADEAERAGIAERLRLPSLARFDAHATMSRDGNRVHATGRIRAQLEQSCVATGDPVAASVDEPFDLLFLPEISTTEDAEIELSEEDCDVVFHDGSTIDLGTALADTLALALDPYPRSASAEAALREAGVLTEEQASPFAVLAKLKGSGEQA